MVSKLYYSLQRYQQWFPKYIIDYSMINNGFQSPDGSSLVISLLRFVMFSIARLLCVEGKGNLTLLSTEIASMVAQGTTLSAGGHVNYSYKYYSYFLFALLTTP
jgi:hypothetical protein